MGVEEILFDTLKSNKIKYEYPGWKKIEKLISGVGRLLGTEEYNGNFK